MNTYAVLGMPQAEILSTKRPVYSVLNLAGAALVLLSLVDEWNLPSAVVEDSGSSSLRTA